MTPNYNKINKQNVAKTDQEQLKRNAELFKYKYKTGDNQRIFNVRDLEEEKKK